MPERVDNIFTDLPSIETDILLSITRLKPPALGS